MRRDRYTKIVATLGPATAGAEGIETLFEAGVDVFRLNFSHGEHADHAASVRDIRDLESRRGRPVAILADLQGPKLRVGLLAGGEARLSPGDPFRLDTDPALGGPRRVELPHPELFDAVDAGHALLLDDGRLRLRVTGRGPEHVDTEVVVGGVLSDHKGLNVPDAVVPVPPLTAKDREDLEFALAAGADWVAASFIQRLADLEAVKKAVDGRAPVMTKLEKPAALDRLGDIIDASDAVMVARGDLGVELPPERVPVVQRRIVRLCRERGRPVVVATQMLESMIKAPIPTRAEASDVATAVYDGVDAVMLSGETAVGRYPVQAVSMMNRIIGEVERDPHYRSVMAAEPPAPQPNAADAICEALRAVAHTLDTAAIVAYTSSGYSALRAARERPESPIVGLTPSREAARRLALVWGTHAVRGEDIHDVEEMVARAREAARSEGFGEPGRHILIMAGMPFAKPGTTNLLRIARI